MEWIDLKEIMPPENETVLVINDVNGIYTCRVPVIIKNLSSDEPSVGRRVRYTHWMPLPAPPQPA